MTIKLQKNEFGVCYLKTTTNTSPVFQTISTKSTYVSVDYKNLYIVGIEFLGGLLADNTNIKVRDLGYIYNLAFMEPNNWYVEDELDTEKTSWINSKFKVYLFNDFIYQINIAKESLPENFCFN
jgi:alpha-L-arabinofuranosidase